MKGEPRNKPTQLWPPKFDRCIETCTGGRRASLTNGVDFQIGKSKLDP